MWGDNDATHNARIKGAYSALGHLTGRPVSGRDIIQLDWRRSGSFKERVTWVLDGPDDTDFSGTLGRLCQHHDEVTERIKRRLERLEIDIRDEEAMGILNRHYWQSLDRSRQQMGKTYTHVLTVSSDGDMVIVPRGEDEKV